MMFLMWEGDMGGGWGIWEVGVGENLFTLLGYK